MHKRIALVSCVKSKQSNAAKAKDLYTSPLFRAFRAYVEHEADEWYILSANYGLVHPEKVISPYEKTLNTMAKKERVAWADKVKCELNQVLPESAEVILLAGARYREGLLPFLADRGITTRVPLEGLPLGKQLQWLKETAARRYHGS